MAETPAEPLNAEEEDRIREDLGRSNWLTPSECRRLLATLDAARQGVGAVELTPKPALGEGQLSGLGPEVEPMWQLGTRLDALLDELVEAGWTGEFDARERSALAKLGFTSAVRAAPQGIIAEGCPMCGRRPKARLRKNLAGRQGAGAGLRFNVSHEPSGYTVAGEIALRGPLTLAELDQGFEAAADDDDGHATVTMDRADFNRLRDAARITLAAARQPVEGSEK